MKKEKQYWLLKTEAGAYSIDDLARDKREPWSGVRNYQARNFMQMMRVGELCFFYHSGDEKAIVGIAKVASKPYPDKTQFDKKSHYYDPKTTPANPRWMLVDVSFVKKFKRPVTLAEVKNDPALRGMPLTKATRLSVQPVSHKHFTYIVGLGSSA